MHGQAQVLLACSDAVEFDFDLLACWGLSYFCSFAFVCYGWEIDLVCGCEDMREAEGTAVQHATNLRDLLPFRGGDPARLL
jgi:hypothetical protein